MKNVSLLFLFLPVMAYSKPTTLADVQHIFTQLTTAVGDYRSDLPQLEIRSSKGQVATYSRLNNTIYIEQAALDICEQFATKKESAIAFLLAHELTHFYQKHDWQEAGFATSFLSKNVIFDQYKSNEEEADTYGAFISHLAGYETISIIPELLDKIYEVYVLADKDLSSYPTLKKRKSVATQVCKKVKDLLHVYEMGNYLFALNQLENAYYCYNYIAKFIRCKEVFNNLGATALAAATLLKDYNQQQFAYPIALDAHLPLRAPAVLTKQQLLTTAAENLALATQYDPTYYIAFISLACTYELQKNTTTYQNLINKLQTLPLTPTEQAQVQILQGITAARKNNTTVAKKYFQQAKNTVNNIFIKKLVQRNEKILAGKPLKLTERESSIFIEDKVDGYNLLTQTPPVQQTITLANDGIQDILLQIGETTQADFFQLNGCKVLMTKQKGLRTKAGIGQGAGGADVEKAYANNKTLNVMGRNWLVCPTAGLLFEMDDNSKKVTKWGIYMIQ